MTESVTTRIGAMQPTAETSELRALVKSMVQDVIALTAQVNQLRADFSGHVHGGVTAGAANTAAAATTATAVTLNTTL